MINGNVCDSKYKYIVKEIQLYNIRTESLSIKLDEIRTESLSIQLDEIRTESVSLDNDADIMTHVFIKGITNLIAGNTYSAFFILK